MWACFKRMKTLAMSMIFISLMLSTHGQKDHLQHTGIFPGLGAEFTNLAGTGLLQIQEVNSYEENRTFGKSESREWMFYSLIGMVLLIASARYYYPQALGNLLRAVRNFNLANQMYRETDASGFLLNSLLYTNFLIVTGMFVYLFLSYFSIGTLPRFDIGSAAIVIGSFAVLYFARLIVLRIVSVVYSFGQEINLFLFHQKLVLKSMGILLIPVLAIAMLSAPWLHKYAIWLGSFIIIIAFIFIIIRGLMIARPYIFAYKFYFFLYICTLEFAPVIVVLKLIKIYWLNP